MVLFIALTGETWGIPNTFICYICRLTRNVTVCSWITVISALRGCSIRFLLGAGWPRTQAAWEEKNGLVSTACACAASSAIFP